MIPPRDPYYDDEISISGNSSPRDSEDKKDDSSDSSSSSSSDSEANREDSEDPSGAGDSKDEREDSTDLEDAPARVDRADGERDGRYFAEVRYFGSHRLTPRLFRDQTVRGFQMVCGWDHADCSRERLISLQGNSIDDTVRLLKYWLILGAYLPDKATHKEFWALAVHHYQDGKIPSHDDLDAALGV